MTWIFSNIANVLNVKLLPSILFKRLVVLSMLVLTYSVAFPTESKIFGLYLPLTVIAAFYTVYSAASVLSARLKHYDMSTIRNATIFADVMFTIGLFAYGIFGVDGIYVMLVFSCIDRVISGLTCPLLNSNISEWVHVTAGKDFKEFQLSQNVFQSLASLVGGGIVIIMGMFLDTQTIILSLGVTILAVNVYSWAVLGEIVQDMKSESYIKRKERIESA